MPLVSVLVTSFLVALSGALVPGPLLMVTVSESPRRGAMTGPLLIVGHGILEGLLVLAILLGLAPILKRPGVFETIALLGAAVLVIMAIQMFRQLPTLSLEGGELKARRSSLILTGALVSLANPYWSLWWITVGLGYILWSMNYGMWGWITFLGGHLLADFFWYSGISVSVAHGRRFLSLNLYRGLVVSCALFLIAFAGYFLYLALPSIFRTSTGSAP